MEALQVLAKCELASMPSTYLDDETDWFICYFRVLGKSFRGDFWRVLTCFPSSFRSIFRTKFPEKIAENPFKTLLKPFKGP